MNVAQISLAMRSFNIDQLRQINSAAVGAINNETVARFTRIAN